MMSYQAVCIVEALDTYCSERKRLLELIKQAQDKIQALDREYYQRKQTCLMKSN
jgi:hypothetical protein